MAKKSFFIIGSVVFLSIAAFIIFGIVKDEKSSAVKNSIEAPAGKEIGQTKNSEELLNAPAEDIETKSGAQKALNDTDALMDAMDSDNPTE